MHKNLVIVESPAKAKTIERFLGKEYTVMSSYGHIRDLKNKEFSVDVEHDYKPTYVVPSDKTKLVNDLKKAAKQAEMVWLASDEDREGEAIAWHLYEELGLKPENTKRIVFHEITKSAILNAIEHPRTIDLDIVNAQQARRVLDRIVGFELSPVLWRKVRPSLSAGRVQSVTVRLVVEREREIIAFTPKASYKASAIFTVVDENGDEQEVKAVLKKRFQQEKDAELFLEKCRDAEFTIENIEKRPGKRTPSAPFTTSTLQQEASRKFGSPVGVTMRVAQSLYESGLITYMRTDSVNLSETAINGAREAIISLAGENYHKERHYNTKSKGAQEAHEAIRPTDFTRTSVPGTDQERRLYELIWKRTVASQMADAILEKTTVTIASDKGEEKFIVDGEVIRFDGFLKVYMESFDDDTRDDNNEPFEAKGMLPKMTVGQDLGLVEMTAEEKFSSRPARYTEASLVRKLEELGIGRPSTYAPTISTIIRRDYVTKKELKHKSAAAVVLTLRAKEITKIILASTEITEKGKLSPTDIGIVVNDFLVQNFPNIMNFNFTADVENQFDKIASGDAQWAKTIDVFYKDFHPNVDTAKNLEGRKVGERLLGTDPKSGKPVYAKISRYGSVAQIGDASDEEKPKFAALLEDQSIETITFDEVMELFKLPIDLGIFEEEPLIVGMGRFGPYVKYGKKYVSIPKEQDPLKMTREKAVALVEKKREEDRKKLLQNFEEEDIKVLNGRFGAYIVHDGANYKIPAPLKAEAETLSLEQLQEIVADESNKSLGRKKSGFKRKTTSTSKKAMAKKAVKKSEKIADTKKKSTKKSTVKKTASKSVRNAVKTATVKAATVKKTTAKRATVKKAAASKAAAAKTKSKEAKSSESSEA